MQALDQTFLYCFLMAIEEGTNSVLDATDYCYYYLTVA